ncbi:hypothetical protein PC116_g17383 [Phytophthora cactorum]|nr:hypothetical protein PC116_g17383 [Phytophthora cactorum]
MVLGKATGGLLIELVRRVDQTVASDLGHLADNVDVGEVGHDLVDLGVPFVGCSKVAAVEDDQAQRRVTHSGKPRLEHLG